MPPADNKSTGRVSFDARGQAFWEWEVSPGVFSRDPDAGQLAALDAASALSLEEAANGVQANAAPGRRAVPGDPRNQVPAPFSTVPQPRKSLDDLRRLSEEIKRTRHWQPPARKER